MNDKTLSHRVRKAAQKHQDGPKKASKVKARRMLRHALKAGLRAE